jgi:hypothetical protein
MHYIFKFLITGMHILFIYTEISVENEDHSKVPTADTPQKNDSFRIPPTSLEVQTEQPEFVGKEM